MHLNESIVNLESIVSNSNNFVESRVAFDEDINQIDS